MLMWHERENNVMRYLPQKSGRKVGIIKKFKFPFPPALTAFENRFLPDVLLLRSRHRRRINLHRFRNRQQRQRRDESLVLVLRLDVILQTSRVDELLAAVLAVAGLVEVRAVSLPAELLVADPADEVALVAVEVLADMEQQLLPGREERHAVLADDLSHQTPRFVLPLLLNDLHVLLFLLLLLSHWFCDQQLLLHVNQRFVVGIIRIILLKSSIVESTAVLNGTRITAETFIVFEPAVFVRRPFTIKCRLWKWFGVLWNWI